jgi:hypothetical protein
MRVSPIPRRPWGRDFGALKSFLDRLAMVAAVIAFTRCIAAPGKTRLYFTVWRTIKEPPSFCQTYGALVLTLSAHVRSALTTGVWCTTLFSVW